jgi:hypothetical protein
VLRICRTVRIHRGASPSCSSPREIYIRRSHASHFTFPTSVIALGHHARSPIHPRRLDAHPPRGDHGRVYHCAHSPWTCVTVLPLSLLQLDRAWARQAHLRGIPRHSRWTRRRLHRSRLCRYLGVALLFATTAHCGLGVRKHSIRQSFSMWPSVPSHPAHTYPPLVGSSSSFENSAQPLYTTQAIGLPALPNTAYDPGSHV